MAQLTKYYPASPDKSRIIFSGKMEDMISHLDEIENRITSKPLSNCGTVFTETVRDDNSTLRTCIYKNVDTDDEETIDINYFIMP